MPPIGKRLTEEAVRCADAVVRVLEVSNHSDVAVDGLAPSCQSKPPSPQGGCAAHALQMKVGRDDTSYTRLGSILRMFSRQMREAISALSE